MPFKDILKKKEKLTDAHAPPSAPAVREPSFETPEFTFMRSDTYTQEIISPPTFSSADSRPSVADRKDGDAESRTSGMFKGRSRRSGWGCTPDPGAAVKYLSAAASNAALIEELALKAGMKKGGAAKGELVLAIFELANCFRYGWGVSIDKLAAKQ
ncbi:hypothetical protein LAWI1_G003207, partial [Lachnellula willkommii]